MKNQKKKDPEERTVKETLAFFKRYRKIAQKDLKTFEKDIQEAKQTLKNLGKISSWMIWKRWCRWRLERLIVQTESRIKDTKRMIKKYLSVEESLNKKDYPPVIDLLGKISAESYEVIESIDHPPEITMVASSEGYQAEKLKKQLSCFAD